MFIACPCCGYLTLNAAQNYETCPVCGWVDVPPADPIARRALNPISLLQAQRNFLAIGASSAALLAFVRPPTPTEQRAADWQPLAMRLRQQQHTLFDRFIGQQPKLFDRLAVQIDDTKVHYLIDPADDAHINQASQQKHRLDYAAMNKIIVGSFPLYPDIYDILENVSGWGEPVECAFACTALLLAARQPQVSSFFELRPALICNLVDSVLRLGTAMIAPALQFLCQSVMGLDLDRHLPEFAVGILILAAALPAVEATQLQELRTWVLQEEQRLGNGADWPAVVASASAWSPRVAAILATLDTQQ